MLGWVICALLGWFGAATALGILIGRAISYADEEMHSSNRNCVRSQRSRLEQRRLSHLTRTQFGDDRQCELVREKFDRI